MRGKNYFASDLNRFINECGLCSEKMTVINIDCLMIKISQRRIRIIESKHTLEHMSKSQETAMLILKDITKNSDVWDVGVFEVRGDLPYNTVQIREFGTDKIMTLNQKEFIQWLNFEDF